MSQMLHQAHTQPILICEMDHILWAKKIVDYYFKPSLVNPDDAKLKASLKKQILSYKKHHALSLF
jgi:hypothetical protein